MNAALALVAGILSTLSPCVLPLVPIVVATAASTHRWGCAALAAGLALSFTAIGLLLATLGFALGIDGEVARRAGAVVLFIVGVVLLVPSWQAKLAAALAPIASRFGFANTNPTGRVTGPLGQFAVGLTLGIVWSPCTGPTLGAATLLASQAATLPRAALTMLSFGIGAASPLALFGMLSREATKRWRGRLLQSGHAGKMLLGLTLVGAGLMTYTGVDRSLESIVTSRLPDWFTALTTRF